MGVHAIATPGISSESQQALAAGATQLGYGQYYIRNGKLEVQLTLEDVRTAKTAKIVSATVPAGDVLGAANALARELSPKIAPYGTRNPQALAAYIRALESADPAVMEVGLNVAIDADPDFGPPYRLLAELKAQRNDRAGALSTIEQALARGNAIPELERARLQLVSAELSGNPTARQAALARLVQLDSGDSAAWRALADVAMGRRDYRTAAQAYHKALELDPDDVILLNLLGYAATQTGDLDDGMKALRRYQALRPNEANPLDSMGDVSLIAGRLSDAEDFFLQSVKKDPNFNNQGGLLKAAIAHLLTGDAAGANTIAERYLRARADTKDQIVDYRRAEWTWISGRRKAAAQQMGAFALANETGPLREVSSRAYAELADWSMMLGDRELAARLAQKALSLAGPNSAGNALIARFFSLPPATASEWTVRAEQQFPGPPQAPIKNFALAYALLLNKQFQPAQLLLREMWESGSPIADEGMPVMLAWCDLETGRIKDAAPLLRTNPIPSAAGLTPYTGFYIPRLLYLRGLLAEKEGRKDDARAWYDKFLAISGPDPLIWGEEKKVRQ
ncbi:MAG: Tetratricopeptide 2 repeat protein [Candidatus Solibacter sp.]|nr:Tetratricopeptide 2 repeat protein [Candidatus Solibacter sp.]